jgi:hypothetical protein
VVGAKRLMARNISPGVPRFLSKLGFKAQGDLSTFNFEQ